MRAVLERRPVKVFATIQTTDKDIAITARMAAGIKAPQDLAGKRVGTIPGTSGEYFLNLFLARYGLNKSGIIVMPFEPVEVVAALIEESIDAMSTWTTMRLSAQEQLPNGTVSFFGDGLYTEAWTLAAREEFLHRRADATRKLLRALLAAERFAAANRQQAIDIAARQLNIHPGTVVELWDNFGFTVRLDQALVVNLEGQARAVIQATSQAQRLNVLDYLRLDELAGVAPNRVTVLH
jgi:ABC-type nitrate/sulfonate/bicarbonate transport system substrate-binding protein